MTGNLISTKICAPQGSSKIVVRSRLFAALDRGLTGKLILLSAPAGFGKTTLLGEWLRRLDRPAAWLALDEADNDTGRFLTYLLAAIQTAWPALDFTALALAPSTQTLSQDGFLTQLINSLNQAQGPPLILVLDDYHLIEAQPVHSVLTFLLDHLPPSTTLILSTRADPPLPIARLRARGQLLEIRAADLRFTTDEAAAFLCQTCGLSLEREDISALAKRTEGWIAGLQLAALSLPNTANKNDFIAAFTGTHEYVADYLADEVLRQQPAAVQSFLLQTAILKRLTGPLCDALTGRQDGQRVLKQLEQHNLFVSSLDDERCWYRYHPLFADLLRQRLQQTYPADAVVALHHRASVWHAQHSLLAEAVDHALFAAEFERAANLLGQIADETLMRGQIATFLHWMDQIPAAVVRQHPQLSLLQAWALLVSGQPLELVNAALKASHDETGPVSEQALAIRAFLNILQGQTSEAIALAQQALACLPPDDQLFHSLATWSLTVARFLSEDANGGLQALESTARTGQIADNTFVAVMALSNLADVRIRAGKLHQAREYYERALQLATGEHGRLPIACYPLLGLGELRREWDDLATADRLLAEGITLSEQWGVVGTLDGYISLAYLRQTQGEAQGARDILEQAMQLAVRSDASTLDDDFVGFHQARLAVLQGDLETATEWLDAWQTAHRATPVAPPAATPTFDFYTHLQKHVDLLHARLSLARAEPERALDLLAALLPQLERASMRIEAHLLRAAAHHARHEQAAALNAIEDALSLGEPSGFVRVFVDEGQPIAHLLYEAAAQGTMPDYTGRLLAACTPSHKAAPSNPAHDLVEPLSARELEILRLIASGATNPEIAQELVIAVNTVKKHVTNILGKLASTSRRQAARRACDLGLLD